MIKDKPSLDYIKRVQIGLARELKLNELPTYREIESKRIIYVNHISYNPDTKEYMVVYSISAMPNHLVSLMCEFDNFLNKFERITK